MAEESKQKKQRETRLRRFKIGWYAVPAVLLLALTIWLLVNMASASGGALGAVLLGIVVVLAVSAVLYMGLERPMHID